MEDSVIWKNERYVKVISDTDMSRMFKMYSFHKHDLLEADEHLIV